LCGTRARYAAVRIAIWWWNLVRWWLT
jgi:hypothetical protein